MESPLPSVDEQVGETYKPSKQEVYEVYDLLNEHVFENKLTRPKIGLRKIKWWGLCLGYTLKDQGRHGVDIHLFKAFPCKQWLVVILAHEMVHQYQWDIHGPERIAAGKKAILSHGPTFVAFRKKLKEFGIPLKTSHSAEEWLHHQDITKI